MKTTIVTSTPSQVEAEALVAVVLDHANAGPNEKDKKPELKVASSDSAVQKVAADLLASGEVSGKPFETNLMHRPVTLMAKRLLLVSGGSAKKFSAYDLRRVAGTAARALKSRGIRSFAFVAPPGIAADEAVRAIVEGTLVGNFDPDYYRSDRKDQKIDAVTVVASGDKAALEKSANEAQIIGESQNFTRDLVNEPSNRMTPTIHGGACEEDVRRSWLEVRGVRRGQDQRNEDGRVLERGAGIGRTSGADCDDLRTGGRSGETCAGACGEGNYIRHGRHLDQARRWHGEDEVRHGGRGHHDWRHASDRAAEAEGQSDRDRVRDGKHAVRESAKTGGRADRDVGQVD